MLVIWTAQHNILNFFCKIGFDAFLRSDVNEIEKILWIKRSDVLETAHFMKIWHQFTWKNFQGFFMLKLKLFHHIFTVLDHFVRPNFWLLLIFRYFGKHFCFEMNKNNKTSQILLIDSEFLDALRTGDHLKSPRGVTKKYIFWIGSSKFNWSLKNIWMFKGLIFKRVIKIIKMSKK